MTLDVARAIERNGYWSRRLGWTQHHSRISSLFTSQPRTAFEFANSVAQWQNDHEPRLQPDGIIGPRTWEVMRFDSGISPAYSPPYLPEEDSTEDVYELDIRGHVITFYDFIHEPGTGEKIERLRAIFERMPSVHLSSVYPIFLVRRHRHQSAGQEGRGGGATIPFGQIRRWSRNHANNSQIPTELIDRLVMQPQTGLITIPRHRWIREFGARGGPGFVVPHEIGHNIDSELRLVPRRLSERDFPGVEDARNVYCGHGNPANRQAAEVYRMLLTSPNRLYHTLPRGMSAQEANRRIMTTLRNSPAFERVPVILPR